MFVEDSELFFGILRGLMFYFLIQHLKSLSNCVEPKKDKTENESVSILVYHVLAMFAEKLSRVFQNSTVLCNTFTVASFSTRNLSSFFEMPEIQKRRLYVVFWSECKFASRADVCLSAYMPFRCVYVPYLCGYLFVLECRSWRMPRGS